MNPTILVVLCIVSCIAYAKDSDVATDCLDGEDPKCKDAENTATFNGKSYCCPDSSSISTSSNTVNGTTTHTCKCGGKVEMPKMPKGFWGWHAPRFGFIPRWNHHWNK